MARNHVVLSEPFWNPFVEYQAADRCHRIGQTKDVTVHRLLIKQTEGHEENPVAGGYTIEDRILEIQRIKQKLVATAMGDSEGQDADGLGARELGYLFGVSSL